MTLTKGLVFGWVLMLLCTVAVTAQSLVEQKKTYTRADTLRGSLRFERTCYDVTYYHLQVEIDTAARTIKGSNTIRFNALSDFKTLQIDLFDNMKIERIVMGDKTLEYRREYNAVFVDMPQRFEDGTAGEFTVYYSGKPVIAKRAPWDGGFTWAYDQKGKLWMGVSCEGIGASLWWPNKDYLGDEPDSMRISCTVPSGLMCVSNGNLLAETRNPNKTTTWHWMVSYPINNYNVTLNIGDYVHLHDEYTAGDESVLSLDYYVLSYNAEKARKHFTQVKPMLQCYERFLGKYPFWDDGYALVETPYLGMEHQSAIAYGNKYLSGYAGRDHSRIGLDFDYIIIHETGHEWWGNSVSCQDIADMWIHESFCTYTEAIYVECMHGYETAMKYVNAVKPTVDNHAPIVGKYGVNEEGDGDMYAKGMLFLNTLRHVVNNDSLWWGLIKNMADREFKHRNTNYTEVLEYFNRITRQNLSSVFEQYLQHSSIPILEYELKKAGNGQFELRYHWQADVRDFSMPFYYSTGGKSFTQAFGTTTWKTITISLEKETDFSINKEWQYIESRKL